MCHEQNNRQQVKYIRCSSLTLSKEKTLFTLPRILLKSDKSKTTEAFTISLIFKLFIGIEEVVIYL